MLKWALYGFIFDQKMSDFNGLVEIMKIDSSMQFKLGKDCNYFIHTNKSLQEITMLYLHLIDLSKIQNKKIKLS